MPTDKQYPKAQKTPQNANFNAGSQTIVAKIISEFKDRNRAEIKKWRQALELATNPEAPRLYLLQDMYDNLESDGHYISNRILRKAAALCNDFSIINRQTGKMDYEKTEFFKEEWFYNFTDDLLDHIFKGFTLLELTNPQKLEFKLIPRRNLVPTKELVLLKTGDDRGISYTTGFENTIIRVGKPTNLGLMADLCGQLIWKRNAQQSWAEFSEKFGMPLITATTNKTNTTDIGNIENMLRALGEAARAVLPEGTTIDIKPFAGGDAYQVFDKQIERINSEISKPMVGGTMLIDSGSSRSQSEVHERNLDEKISLLDKLIIEFIVNGQLLSVMQTWGHKIDPVKDKFKYEATFELSLSEHWEIVSNALNFFDIPIDWISKTFNMPIDGIKEIQAQQPVSNNLKPAATISGGSFTGALSENFR